MTARQIGSKSVVACDYRRCKPLLWLLATVALHGGCLASADVMAQQIAAESSARLDEIVVTALKVAQPLSDVPASITVVEGAKLEEMGAVQFEDYFRMIPSLTLTSGGLGLNSLSLRGIPNLSLTTATVGLFLDDIPLAVTDSRASASNPLAVDLDRIEVLRGPQGTLYGSSAMGGTVRFVSKQPDLTELAARISADYSRTDNTANNYSVTGTVNIPLIDERAALRMTVFSAESGGYIDRIVNPYIQSISTVPAATRAQLALGQEGINDEFLKLFRAQLLLKISDNVTLTPAFLYQSVSETNQPTIATNTALQYQGLVTQVSLTEPRSDWFKVFSVTANIDFGWGQLVSTTAYDFRKFRVTSDKSDEVISDFNGVGLLTDSKAGTNVTITSHETRLVTSPSGSPWTTITGVFYSELTDHGGVDESSPGFGAAAGIPPSQLPADLFYSQDDLLQRRQFAVFNNTSYKFTSKLTGEAGLRLFTDNQDFVYANDGLFNGGPTLRQGVNDGNGATPKAALNYKFSEGNIAYLNIAKGYRDGGANYAFPSTCDASLAALGLSAAPTGYNPDSLWNYEAGVRSLFADGRYSVHGALYYIDWTNIQVAETPSCGYTYRTNAGRASSKGAELEVNARPIPGLTLTAGMGYSDARINKADPGIPGSYDGAPMPGVPKASYSVTFEYESPREAAVWRPYVGGDFSHTGGFNTQLGPIDPTTRQEAISLANFHLGMRNDLWRANMYLKNAFDERATLSLSGGAQLGSAPILSATIQTPRTVGVSITRLF